MPRHEKLQAKSNACNCTIISLVAIGKKSAFKLLFNAGNVYNWALRKVGICFECAAFLHFADTAKLHKSKQKARDYLFTSDFIVSHIIIACALIFAASQAK